MSPKKPMPIEERFWPKVNKEGPLPDAKWGVSGRCWLWTGSQNKGGYGQMSTRMHESPIGAHRVSYQLFVGPLSAGEVVDHVCHTRLCVNPEHLRTVTNKQNGENRTGHSPNNTSGFRGVTWDSGREKWMGQIGHNGKRVHLGRFDDLHEAAEAVRVKRLELFTHNDADRRES